MLTLEQQNYAYNAYLETMKYLNKPKSLLHPNFGSNSAMYVFATENLVDYIKRIKPVGKKALTITESGDQLINLALMGVSTIDNFDINQNAYFIVQLKLAALKVLSYEEFLNFFCLYEDEEISNVNNQQKNSSAFSFKIYLQIKPYLDETSAFFWNLIYEDFQFNGEDLASSILFYNSVRAKALTNNTYLKNEGNYLKAREMIDGVQINYVECNLFDVHNLPDLYDIMLFFNLTSDCDNVMTQKDFVSYIEGQVSSRLNDAGIIAFFYHDDYKARSYVNQELINRVLNKEYALNKLLQLEIAKKILLPFNVKGDRIVENKDCVYLYEKEKSE